MNSKSFLVALFFMSAGMQTAWAQKMVVKLTDNQIVKYRVSQIECVMFEEEGEHEYVDLGLPSGTLWATCNIGADSPEEYGDYFAWGETEVKASYNWSTYKHCNGTSGTMKKYCTNSSYGYNGFTDGLTELSPEDDAATVNWGSEWQTPSAEQLAELINSSYTITTRTTQNGISGLKITSKSNAKWIFLPAAGFREDTSLKQVGNGNYWSRSLGTSKSSSGCMLFFSSSRIYVNGDDGRYYGENIRPVRVKEKIETHEYVDLGLPSGTLWATCNVGANSPEEYGDYFAWGETIPKDSYLWETYKYYGESDANHYPHGVTKYYYWYERDNEGNLIVKYDKCELESKDDAATANWGSEWQMPSSAQFDELINSSYTTTEWLSINGKNVRKITSISNGKYIYLPAAGRNDGLDEETPSLVNDIGYYWSRTLGSNGSGSWGTLKLNFNSDVIGNGSDYNRYGGLSVRPVRVKEDTAVSHEYVDLGLPSGTLWATCNVGANSPEEYGDYFAWGETQPKEDYSTGTYQYCVGAMYRLTKYCWDSDYGYNGFTDTLTELLPEDDAATANWGSEWQMPSVAQFKELFDSRYTRTELTTMNDVSGRKIISRDNSNSIFLPIASCYSGTTLKNEYYPSGYYWSRSLYLSYDGSPNYAYYLSFDTNYSIFEDDFGYRDSGESVRPVRKK